MAKVDKVTEAKILAPVREKIDEKEWHDRENAKLVAFVQRCRDEAAGKVVAYSAPVVEIKRRAVLPAPLPAKASKHSKPRVKLTAEQKEKKRVARRTADQKLRLAMMGSGQGGGKKKGR